MGNFRTALAIDMGQEHREPARNGAHATSALHCEFDTVADDVWNDALGQFDDPHYEQTACYIAGQRGERGSHVLMRHGGIPVAGARVAVYTPPGLKRGVALVRFGPFWRRRDQAADFDIYRAALGALVEEYCDRRGHCLTIRPRPNPDFYQHECEVLDELGFMVRRKMDAPERYLVNASLDEDAAMKSFDQKWRYNLRQALANNLDIRWGETDSDIATFQALHDTMVARKHVSHGGLGLVDTTRDLARLPAPLTLRVVLAFHQGRAVAGATVGVLGDTAYYVLGASDDAALELKAGYAVQWWILRWLTTQDVRWYELGGTGDHGVRQFKKGLIGKHGTVLVMNGEYDRWTDWRGKVTTDLIYTARDLQNWIRAQIKAA